MGSFRITTTKFTTFQGKTEEFSNVYVLDTGTLEAFDDEAAIDGIIALEKKVFSSNTGFRRATSYGINPIRGDVPRYGKELAGNGLVSVQLAANFYPECAILVKFELPRPGGQVGIGKRRMLRKWLHTGTLPGSAEEAEGKAAALSVQTRAFYTREYAEPLRTGSFGGGSLSAPNGDKPISTSTHPYLEHRQFHAGKKKPAGVFG